METTDLSKENLDGIATKLKNKPIMTIVAFVMSLGSIGIGGYLGSIWYDSIDKAVVKSDVIKEKVHEWVDERIEEKLNDPITWLEVLASKHVEDFAKSKATEVRESVKQEMIKMDSSKTDFIDVLGKAMGIRNEDVLPMFSKLMKEYISGTLGTRSVRATF